VVSLNRLMVPMTSTRLLNLSALLDDAKCFALVRQHRWPDGVHCPSCGSAGVTRHGRDRIGSATAARPAPPVSTT